MPPLSVNDYEALHAMDYNIDEQLRFSPMAGRLVEGAGEVYVSFIGNQHTLHHLEAVRQEGGDQKALKCPKRKRSQRQSEHVSEAVLDDVELAEHGVGPAACDGGGMADTEGKELYGFKVYKTYKGSSRTTENPGAASTSVQSKDDSTRSKGLPQRGKPRRVQTTTPYRLAKRLDHNDGSEESDSASSDSEGSTLHSESDAYGEPKKHAVPNLVEDFFNAQSSRAVTSDHTLSCLREDGMLDQVALADILNKRPNHNADNIRALYAQHGAMFKTWMLQLCCGFNMILYGYGSKMKLIEKFRQKHCSCFHHVVINGFFPSLTLKNILNAITEDCLGLGSTYSDTDLQIAAIETFLTDKDEALFVIIHNIDGPMVRLASTQQALASLATIPNVHLVASVDHINAPLMWSQMLLLKFNWIWYDATTFEPYLEETSYENSMLIQQSGALALRSMVNVFWSLTPNARNIFLLLARYHLDHVTEQAYMGMPFQLLYQKCRESFLVNSDQTLRTQLTEFRDHKLIRFRKGVDGAEQIFLPIDTSTLKDFLEQANCK